MKLESIVNIKCLQPYRFTNWNCLLCIYESLDMICSKSIELIFTLKISYCYLNNVAIGAMHCLNNLGLERILIVDWDVHHGQVSWQLSIF